MFLMLLMQTKSLKKKINLTSHREQQIGVCRLTSVGRTFLQEVSYNKDCSWREPAALNPLGGLRGWCPTLGQGPSWLGLEEAGLNDH